MGASEDRMMRDFAAREEQLLDNGFRNDTARVAGIIDGEFLEFTESGKKLTHKAGDRLDKIDGALYILSDTTALTMLAEDCALLSYTAVKVNDNIRAKTNCGSVWKKSGGGWKILFHQRTTSAD